MKLTMTAKLLRVILMAGIVLVVAAVAGGFFFAHKNLASYATQISQLNANASSGDQDIATLKSLKTRLSDEQFTIESARSIVADDTSFAEKVVSDVSRIAKQSGVTIASLEYVDSTAGASASTAAPPATAAPTQPAVTGTPAGITKKSISVTIASPVDYTSLMTFIQNIERNNLKLQLASVSMTKDKGNMVATQTFSIGAYVR